MSERMNVMILGRDLGTSDGWDGDPGETIWFYDFQPHHNVLIPLGDLHFDTVDGWLTVGDPVEPEWKVDACTFLAPLPRA